MLLTKSTPLTYTTACMNCKAPTTVSVSLDVNAPTSVSEQMMPPDHKPYLAQPANYSTPTKPVWQRHELNIAKANRHLVKDKGASWDPQKGVWWINLDVNTGMTDSDWCFDAFNLPKSLSLHMASYTSLFPELETDVNSELLLKPFAMSKEGSLM